MFDKKIKTFQWWEYTLMSDEYNKNICNAPCIQFFYVHSYIKLKYANMVSLWVPYVTNVTKSAPTAAL